MTRTWRWGGLAVVLATALVGCGDDGGGGDAGGDAGADSGPMDSGMVDTGTPDTGVDTGTPDAGPACTEGCDIVELVAGYAHSCALRENGSVLCWGGNEEGELGDDRTRHSDECTPEGVREIRDCTSQPQEVVELTSAIDLSAEGGLATCARVEGGDVYCWGREPVIDPASTDYRKRYTPELIDGFSGATDLSDSQSFGCAVLDDATVACLGDNDAGQLGDDTTTERREAAAVMGLTGAVDVEVSHYPGEFACAVTATDVQCWGGNEFNQLGDGSTTHSSCGDLDDERDCSLTPVTVTDLTDPEELSFGIDHACARMADGSIVCWGRNSSRALAMDVTGPVETPTVVDAISGVEQLAAGGYHTCALIDDGSVKCWGANDQGQLGDGSRDHGESCGVGGTSGDCSTTPVDVALPGPGTATYLASGYKHSCAVLTNGEVWCWGWNDRRQTGVDDRNPQPTPVQVQIP